MKTLIVSTCIFYLGCLAPSCAFVGARQSSFGLPLSSSLVVPNKNHNHRQQQQPNQNSPFSASTVRGGGLNPLQASGADYTDAAKALFGNIVSPAAMLIGGLVPLGFLAEPLPKTEEGFRWARKLYMVLSVLSIANELLAIMYATVASNKLTETIAAPAASVFALIKRDYELSWVATNVHFMLGLLGFIGMIMCRALTLYPLGLNTASAGLAFSAFLGMVSIVNLGVAEGDGRGDKLGGNIFTLGTRYLMLLMKQCHQKRTVLGTIALVMFGVSSILTVKNLMDAKSAA